MKRHWAWLWPVIVLAAVLPPTPGDGGEPDPSLKAELAKILGEILESEDEGHNPFESGAIPDLIVLGSANVVGEVAPCG